MLKINNIYLGDCLDVMKNINDNTIDLILCDLPYGTTKCKWDVLIPFDKLWDHYKRIIKENGVIALFGTEPFSSHLRISNTKWYKYDWIWEKSRFSNQMQAKRQPLKIHENISIFYKKFERYYPQGVIEVNKETKQGKKISENNGGGIRNKKYIQTHTNYPKSIQRFKSVGRTIHSTQKPVKLLEFIIKTYTKDKELVLDNCMGSGSTIIASLNTNRQFIGIEKNNEIFNLAKERIKKYGGFINE